MRSEVARAPAGRAPLDAVIVGHGLAGAVLAHTLAEAGWRVVVVDEFAPDSASRVAAGLVNPLAGRRFALTWRAETLLPAAAAFYRQTAAALGVAPFWHERPIWKFFTSPQEAADGLARVGTPFIGGAFPATTAPDALRAPHGGLVLRGGGFLQTESFLAALAAHRQARGEWRAERFAHERLTTQAPLPAPVQYQLATGEVLAAHRVIFCEGAAVVTNPLFNWLPFTANNGQVLDIALTPPTGLPPDVVLNSGAYAVPQPGASGVYRLGATYEWGADPPAPTPAGRADLLGRLARVTALPAQVTAHRAGRRPAVRDRRPLLGFHPADARLVLFNGFGSKGVGLAPGLAAHLAAVLAGPEALWPEVNLARFAALYPSP